MCVASGLAPGKGDSAEFSVQNLEIGQIVVEIPVFQAAAEGYHHFGAVLSKGLGHGFSGSLEVAVLRNQSRCYAGMIKQGNAEYDGLFLYLRIGDFSSRTRADDAGSGKMLQKLRPQLFHCFRIRDAAKYLDQSLVRRVGGDFLPDTQEVVFLCINKAEMPHKGLHTCFNNWLRRDVAGTRYMVPYIIASLPVFGNAFGPGE